MPAWYIARLADLLHLDAHLGERGAQRLLEVLGPRRVALPRVGYGAERPTDVVAPLRRGPRRGPCGSGRSRPTSAGGARRRPRRRSSSATKWGVRNSRRLPRWIGPGRARAGGDGHEVALAGVADRVVRGSGHPVGGVAGLSAPAAACHRCRRPAGLLGLARAARLSAGRELVKRRKRRSRPPWRLRRLAPLLWSDPGRSPESGARSPVSRGRCLPNWLAPAGGTNLPPCPPTVLVRPRGRSGLDRDVRASSTTRSSRPPATRSWGWPACCRLSRDVLLRDLAPLLELGLVRLDGQAGDRPADGRRRRRPGPPRGARWRGRRASGSTALAGAVPHLVAASTRPDEADVADVRPIDGELSSGGNSLELLGQMLRTSRGDMLWLRPDAWAMPRESAVSAMLAEAIATGRKSRAIYPVRALSEAPEALQTRARIGEQIRVISELPTRMFILGHDHAVLPEPLGFADEPRVHIRQRSIVDGADLCGSTRCGHARRRCPTSTRARRDPTCGASCSSSSSPAATDEIIARKLGISLRTVRRRVAAMMAELGRGHPVPGGRRGLPSRLDLVRAAPCCTPQARCARSGCARARRSRRRPRRRTPRPGPRPRCRAGRRTSSRSWCSPLRSLAT